MPRVGRVVLANYPHHIVQRGHNRQVVFAAERDFEYYVETLSEYRSIYGVQVYAWCLMTNHIHLIVEPPEEVTRLGQLMKRLAGRQTRYVNRLEGRKGTLWESRYKSSPIQTDEYLLACCRYVELNPVRARMVAQATDHKWGHPLAGRCQQPIKYPTECISMVDKVVEAEMSFLLNRQARAF